MDNGSIRKIVSSGYRKIAVFLVKRIGTIVLQTRKERINEDGNDFGEK